MLGLEDLSQGIGPGWKFSQLILQVLKFFGSVLSAAERHLAQFPPLPYILALETRQLSSGTCRLKYQLRPQTPGINPLNCCCVKESPEDLPGRS